ncbi:MAG: hypothetical protein A4E19_10215 [Nitrospira sp. SG-bin1]|nr:MAG: hypothetical protein A4E19_10215 [Nitrospira sp. SG-bin1]
MIAGLFLGLLLSISFLLWIVIRQRQENILNSTVVEATNCSVLVTDTASSDHPIVYVNSAFLSLTGYAEHEVIGQTTSILSGPGTDRASVEKLAMAVQGGWSCRVRLHQYRKNGTAFFSDVSLSPVKDALGRVTSIIWTINEVSENEVSEIGPLRGACDRSQYENIVMHRQAEEALRESETRLELAVQIGQVGIFEYDHRADSSSWSPILRDICGVGVDEAASWQRYLELVHPDDRERVISMAQQARSSTGNGTCEVEHRLIRPGGGVQHVNLRSLVSFEGDGASRQPIRTLGTVVDITDRKHVEARRRETARMEAIGTFAGGIAHELNNGLTAVLGFSELALPLLQAESKAHRHIRQVVAAAKKSRELIQQLLAFGAQNNQGRCPLLLHSLVKESLRFLRPTIPLWIELKAQIAHATTPIFANAVQMHEMIFQLIDNAIREMQTTGGILEVQLQSRELITDQILPSGRLPAGRYVYLSVRDTSQGIDAEDVGSFLKPKVVAEREGVGLAVVYDIVVDHGGALTVESHIDSGTWVSVYLPALPSCAQSIAEKDVPLPHGHECILFVDDEESVVRFGREVLESLGYSPVVCQTPREALDVFRAEPKRFDLLITDRTMPGMSGDHLAKECRELRSDLPVILCSGSHGIQGADDAYSKEVTECLLKPLTLYELAYSIRRALDQSPSYPEWREPPADSGPASSRISIEVSDAVSPRG